MSIFKKKQYKYSIYEAENKTQLENIVRELLKDGWELVGGISSSDRNTGSGIHHFYVQALRKTVK